MSYQATAGASVSRKRLYSATSSEAAAAVSNRLLAGYMAYEFLEKGTLFGQTFEAADLKRSRKSKEEGLAEPNYFEVANLVKSQGVHVAGVVNPTQLDRWIRNIQS